MRRSPIDYYYPCGLALIALDVTAVTLRFWARRMTRSTGYDDWTLAVALAMFIVLVAMYLKSADMGVGNHLDPGHHGSWEYFTIAGVAHYLALAFSKLSIGLVLYRLTDQTGMQRIRTVLIVTMVGIMIVALTGAAILSRWYQYVSGTAAGRILTEQETSTMVTAVGISGLVVAVVDLGVSWFYALLPIHFLRKITLPTKIKILAGIILGLGALSSAISIMRLHFTTHVAILLAEQIDSREEKELALKFALYSMQEIGVSIFAASLTAVRPILVKASTWTSSITSSFASRKSITSLGVNASADATQSDENRASGHPLRNVSPEPQKILVRASADQVPA